MFGAYARDERGMTLIEVLAAMVIAGIVVVAFVEMSRYAAAADARSAQFAEAVRLAEEKLNLAKRTVYEFPEALMDDPETAGDYTVVYQLTKLNASDPADNYRRDAFLSKHVSLQSVVLSGGSSYLLTVTVTWGDPDE